MLMCLHAKYPLILKSVCEEAALEWHFCLEKVRML